MLERLKKAAEKIKGEVHVWKWVLKDNRTPFLSKILLGLAVGYVLLPFDLIPDWIPGLGFLDDLVIVTALVFLALKLVPKEVVEEARLRARLGK